MSFFEFPHTRTYDSDLGFLIKWLQDHWSVLEDLEEWRVTHEEEYNELVARVNNILPELLAAMPDYVQAEVIHQMNEGTFQELIVQTAEFITTNYLNELYDLTAITALQTKQGDYILTVGGEYIFINTASTLATAYTTNEMSYFYSALKDAENKVKSGKKPLNASWRDYLTKPPVLTLAHISDYHGDSQELEYIYTKWDSVMGLADDWICTGDMVAERFTDPFLFYPTSDNLMAKSTLLCIGNHDALNDPGYDWNNLATEAQQYNKFFAPTIDHWGVVHVGDNTYYYKDYVPHGIRLIVLNDMLQGADMQAQLYWLENTALQTNLAVVIAKHYIPPHSPVKIDCPFTAIDYNATGLGNTTIADIVDRFIGNGGTFICYMVGHSHYDYVCYLSEYPQQIAIAVDAAGRQACNDWSDMMRYDNEISRDLFNMIQFDTSSELIKITRCGANYDRYMRHKDTLCLNYRTQELYT